MIQHELDDLRPVRKAETAARSRAGKQEKGARKAAARARALPATPAAPLRLPLGDSERAEWARTNALTIDVDGAECLRGLTRAESIDYIALHRRGLDNDDAGFLRYILLGDRHVVALAAAGPA